MSGEPGRGAGTDVGVPGRAPDDTEPNADGGEPSSPARWAALVVGALALVLVVLLATGGTDTGGAESPLIDNPAPALDGATLDGGTYDLAEMRGRWVVVNFFASWCAPCRVEHPELVRFSEDHADDASVVSVAFDDAEADSRAFFEDLGGDWPVLVGGTGPTAIAYGITKVPETFLVDPGGVVREKWISSITADDLEAAIAEHGGGAS